MEDIPQTNQAQVGSEIQTQQPDTARAKALLDVPAQIAKLKSKGVTFDLCTEDEAAAYLTDRTYFFKLYAYRTLFERRVGGPRDGQYVNLDFGHLKLLASLDRTLRYALLPMTLDVEHFARVKLVREVTEREGEDGYSIVSDHLAALNHKQRNRRTGEVGALSEDAYCSALVEKYTLPDDMPLWVYLELVSFGSFISIYLFCAERWGDRAMREEYFQLRQSKAARNAFAHSSNVINGFANAASAVDTNASVMRALAEAGISHRVRSAKMRNPRLQQIATLLYLHSQIVPEGTSRSRAQADIARLETEMRTVLAALPENDAIRSSFGFLMTLFDKWF